MANRHWVGGTDAWDATAGTKWALTSGGVGGEAVPTTNDDVFLDANSGAVTITLGGTPYCHTLDCSNFTGTLNYGAYLFISGSLIFSPGMTIGDGGFVSNHFISTSSGNIIDMGGINPIGFFSFSGVGGEWILASDLIFDADSDGKYQGIIELTAGTLDTDGYAISVSFITIGADGEPGDPVSFYMKDSVITINGETDEGHGFEVGYLNGGTVDAGTSHLIITGDNDYSSYYTVLGGGGGMGGNPGLTLYDVTIQPPTTWIVVVGVSNWPNPDPVYLNIHTFTIIGEDITVAFSGGGVIAENLIVDGGTDTDHPVGISGPISAESITLKNIKVMDSDASGGAAPFTGTDLDDIGGNTGWDFGSPVIGANSTVTANFTADSSGNSISFNPYGSGVSNFRTRIDNISIRRITYPAVSDDRPVKEFLIGTDDDGREVFFRVDTQELRLTEGDSLSSLVELITETERGSDMKIFLDLGDGTFYELEGDSSKDISVIPIHARDRNDVTPPSAKSIKISWRDGSKFRCRVIQGELVYIPTNITEVK